MKFTPRILIAVLNSLLVLVLYVFYFLFFILARVIPGKLYRKIIQTVYNSSVIIWRSIVFLSNSTSDKIDAKDSAIVISNHVQSTDMAILAEMAAKFGPGHGFARYIVKKSVIYVPFFGLVHWLLGDVFLQRKWEQDQQTMTNFTRNFPQSLSKWLVIFPEGTRAGGRKKLAVSQAWAKENGYPALSHVMYPRPRGFATLVQGFQKHNSVDCVYDVTILYPQADLTRTARTMDMLCGGRKQHIAVVVNRFPISSLPSDDQGIQQWLYARWQTKQKYYDAWLQSGFDTAAVSRVHASPVGRNTTQVDRVPVEMSSTMPATATPTAPLSAVPTTTVPAPAADDGTATATATRAAVTPTKRRVRATT